ncbi:MAG TPA: YeeE/YedE family protein [Burkholderiaceae bacterium]|nr:YeeE/YedE family protein [Burkholderiaceae bacterium]
MFARFARHRMRSPVALFAGIVFGLGLGVAGMVDPLKVLAFLDVAGDWDPGLLLVLGVAVPIAAIGQRMTRRKQAPCFDDRFHLTAHQGLDAPLWVGSVLFGIGWGLAGYCPGPAIASLAYGNAEALWFVPAMLAGAGLHRWWQRVRSGRAATSTP